MQTAPRPEVTLALRADFAFLPLATSFAEKACEAFGLGRNEGLALTLATEEIFAYLCKKAAPGSAVTIRCAGLGYYVEEDFLFEARDFDLQAFNLTSSLRFDDPAALEETGLLIASRMVDGLRFFKDESGLRLRLRKEKVYPPVADKLAPEARPLQGLSVRPPDSEELKLFVRMALQRYSPMEVDPSFAFPGKVVDMVGSGEYFAVIAADRAGHIGGGALWRWEGDRLIEFLGPYVFDPLTPATTAVALIDHLISTVARTRALGMINIHPTPDIPLEYFEILGALDMYDGSGEVGQLKACYRRLDEDMGLSVWASPEITPFLHREYERLFFAREIKPAKPEGETASPHAVLSAALVKSQGRARLRPIWWGLDAKEVLAAHVGTLLREGFLNLFFIMDLGESWACHFAPALLECGFEPRIVLPYGGKGDLLLFQHIGGEPLT